MRDRDRERDRELQKLAQTRGGGGALTASLGGLGWRSGARGHSSGQRSCEARGCCLVVLSSAHHDYSLVSQSPSCFFFLAFLCDHAKGKPEEDIRTSFCVMTPCFPFLSSFLLCYSSFALLLSRMLLLSSDGRLITCRGHTRQGRNHIIYLFSRSLLPRLPSSVSGVLGEVNLACDQHVNTTKEENRLCDAEAPGAW